MRVFRILVVLLVIAMPVSSIADAYLVKSVVSWTQGGHVAMTRYRFFAAPQKAVEINDDGQLTTNNSVMGSCAADGWFAVVEGGGGLKGRDYGPVDFGAACGHRTRLLAETAAWRSCKQKGICRLSNLLDQYALQLASGEVVKDAVKNMRYGGFSTGYGQTIGYCGDSYNQHYYQGTPGIPACMSALE